MPAFTISEAARHCGVDRRTLQRAIRSGRLALTQEHHLTPEALAQAGYLPAARPQVDAAGAPHHDAASVPQAHCDAAAGAPQLMPRVLERLDRLEVLLLKLVDIWEQFLHHAVPQGDAATVPPLPQGVPQDATEAPQETPQEVRHTAGAPQAGPAAAPSLDTLPAHIQRIAEAAMQYGKLTLEDLSQLLFDRQIYRARDRTSGADKPVNRGTLHKWLEQARRAGVL